MSLWHQGLLTGWITGSTAALYLRWAFRRRR